MSIRRSSRPDEQRPDFFYIYLPHLDYAAQKNGPESAEAQQAVVELDEQIGKLRDGFTEAYSGACPLTPALSPGERERLTWLVASEYAIVPVDHVLYPNRMLREAGLLKVRDEADGEHLDFAASRAGRWSIISFRTFLCGRAMRRPIEEVRELFTDHVGRGRSVGRRRTGPISSRPRTVRRGRS